MSQKLKQVAGLSAAALALALMTGCAATGDTGALQSEIDAVKQAAAQAQSTADEAKAQAEAALTAANEAKEMASKAEGVARAAEFTAERNAKRQEQMFKKSMYK